MSLILINHRLILILSPTVNLLMKMGFPIVVIIELHSSQTIYHRLDATRMLVCIKLIMPVLSQGNILKLVKGKSIRICNQWQRQRQQQQQQQLYHHHRRRRRRRHLLQLLQQQHHPFLRNASLRTNNRQLKSS